MSPDVPFVATKSGKGPDLQRRKENNDATVPFAVCLGQVRRLPAAESSLVVVHDAAQHVEVLTHVRRLRVQPELRTISQTEHGATGSSGFS